MDKNGKIVLGVDLDEVVFVYLKSILKVMEEKRLPVPTSDPEFFSMVESGWFESVEIYKKVHGEAVERGLYERLAVMDGASETLWDLARSGYEINIITSRFVNPGQHGLVVPQTAAALELHNIPYSSLSFLADKTKFMADAYIDDGPHNLEPLQALDRFTITFDQRYNRHVPGPRATNWGEVRAILREKFGR